MASSAVVKRAAKDQTVSQTVVSAVAEFTGSEPDELEPLYHTVDPEALDALFDATDPGRSPNRVAFTYCDCDVVVTTGGAVQVSEPELASPKPESNAVDNVRG